MDTYWFSRLAEGIATAATPSQVFLPTKI